MKRTLQESRNFCCDEETSKYQDEKERTLVNGAAPEKRIMLDCSNVSTRDEMQAYCKEYVDAFRGTVLEPMQTFLECSSVSGGYQDWRNYLTVFSLPAYLRSIVMGVNSPEFLDYLDAFMTVNEENTSKNYLPTMTVVTGLKENMPWEKKLLENIDQWDSLQLQVVMASLESDDSNRLDQVLNMDLFRKESGHYRNWCLHSTKQKLLFNLMMNSMNNKDHKSTILLAKSMVTQKISVDANFLVGVYKLMPTKEILKVLLYLPGGPLYCCTEIDGNVIKELIYQYFVSFFTYSSVKDEECTQMVKQYENSTCCVMVSWEVAMYCYSYIATGDPNIVQMFCTYPKLHPCIMEYSCIALMRNHTTIPLHANILYKEQDRKLFSKFLMSAALSEHKDEEIVSNLDRYLALGGNFDFDLKPSQINSKVVWEKLVSMIDGYEDPKKLLMDIFQKGLSPEGIPSEEMFSNMYGTEPLYSVTSALFTDFDFLSTSMKTKAFEYTYENIMNSKQKSECRQLLAEEKPACLVEICKTKNAFALGLWLRSVSEKESFAASGYKQCFSKNCRTAATYFIASTDLIRERNKDNADFLTSLAEGIITGTEFGWLRRKFQSCMEKRPVCSSTLKEYDSIRSACITSTCYDLVG